ncbi:IS3 family transposase [Seramator thermalis]|uniref:IS3 family transposase n=1 Tax=Seramator thermalis TaxID=2496270 RepID=UPI00101D69D5|nr:IS3 family transposase [Seramator thermalis]
MERRILVSKDDCISLQSQCDLLVISKSGLYYLPKGESDENLEIMKKMDKYHHDHPTYGVLQMQDYLFAPGFLVNPKRVRRLMRKARITAQYPKRNLSKLGLAGYIYPYLLRNLNIDHPNQVWEIDITYIPMDKGFMYLTAIIDVYSRFIVGWGLHNSLHGENVIEVLEAAMQEHGVPEIINSDQGSQFTSPGWVNRLNELGIGISMDGRGRATDNIYIERFWRTLKQDYVYPFPAENGTTLWKGLRWFMNHYNKEKTNQGIGRRTPESVFRLSA